jgi:DNA-binding beta-propeller fold protein YncE
MFRSFFPAFCAVLALAGPAFAAPHETGFSVTETRPLPGAPKWDYLVFDAGGDRLFVTHGDHVDVIDAATSKIAGAIPGTEGVHGVALAPELNRGFTSNGKSNSVSIFELSTLKVLETVPAEKKPDAIVFDTASQRVFAANGDSGSLTAIDAASGTPLGSAALGGKPEFAAVDGKGRLFVNIQDRDQIAVIDTKKLAVTAHYDISSACHEPTGLALDAQKGRLFSTCHNQVMAVVDADSGKVLAAPPIGQGSDAAVFDAATGLAFSSNGDGTLTVVAGDGKGGYAVRENVKTRPGARTMALDSRRGRLYLVTGDVQGVEAATKEHPYPRPQFRDNSFTLLTVAQKQG